MILRIILPPLGIEFQGLWMTRSGKQMKRSNLASVPLETVSASVLVLRMFKQRDTELILNYLNGPRQLSQKRLSKITLFQRSHNGRGVVEFDVLLAATHFVGDGLALNVVMNDFWSLLAGNHIQNHERKPRSTAELWKELRQELDKITKVGNVVVSSSSSSLTVFEQVGPESNTSCN